ncbi:thylakoid lumenal 17.9 kDa protein, chloroplastic-like isoform X1 [Musa acuminata AAA Group]|uniref:thylakoid lumenal 17.9 kDa protein, chloroplastic isoform X1 n=1 Tax=Musa acuminata AAA Group TaxID=214697 RepID=UPI0008A09E92|nr:PREDICTED: thylakoid lumenal 17.9 kDa protein, chloroplastic isoform X3 [Musa acuminata subsp. malaccensis]
MEMSSTAAVHCCPIPSVSKPRPSPLSSLMLQAKGFLLSSLAPLGLAIVLSSPLPSVAALPYPNPQSPPSSPATPYAQSQKLQLGLENGKIRACPSINPGCVSTNPNSSSFAFPWMIPDNFSGDVIQSLRDAILRTQRNVEFKVDEETPDGQSRVTYLTLHLSGNYIQAEVDGGFGRDVMEFLVRKDVVAFRSMATKVTYIYPFTTALGDSKGQIERINRIKEELGWYAPNFESMD